MISVPTTRLRAKIFLIANAPRVFMFLGLVAAFLIAGPLSHSGDAKATPGSVVINELMYNPASNVDFDEYIELYNTTGDTIDLSGWCFTKGVTLCFASGKTIAAHSYAAVSPNAARSLLTYGVTTVGTYTGKLDNGGETVALSDNTAVVIDSVKYDDDVPWATTPDGFGPSLELRLAVSDHNASTSWGASLSAPTPGVVNSLTIATQC